MATVTVQQPHSMSTANAIAQISDFEEMMQKYGVKAQWSGAHADLKGMGVSGSIDVTDSEVVVVVKLGMMAKAVGVDPVRLKASIEKRLLAAFAETQ